MRHVLLTATVLLTGCSAAIPPAAPTPRTGTRVAASFDKTWSAVIDVFAAKNIPIKNLDKSSGFIATEEMAVPGRVAAKEQNPYADCGTTNIRTNWQPTHANYNIRVKNEGGSNVQVTVFWKSVLGRDLPTTTCTSRGVWEAEAEGEIKAKAESR